MEARGDVAGGPGSADGPGPVSGPRDTYRWYAANRLSVATTQQEIRASAMKISFALLLCADNECFLCSTSTIHSTQVLRQEISFSANICQMNIHVRERMNDTTLELLAKIHSAGTKAQTRTRCIKPKWVKATQGRAFVVHSRK